MSAELYPTLPRIGITDVSVTGSLVTIGTGSVAFPGTTGSTILQFNAQRVAAIIVNWSGNTGYLAFETGSLTTTTGIPIEANGGVVSFNIAEDPAIVSQAMYGILTNSTGSWLVMQASGA